LTDLTPHLPGIPQRFDPNFYLDLPSDYKHEHRGFTADFRIILIGNVWNPMLVQDLSAMWIAARQKIPAVPPIIWHCHPTGIARVRAAGVSLGNTFTIAEFLAPNQLSSALRQADLAVIPFSRRNEPQTDYERYSMPSRTTEIAAAGIPTLCLAGTETPLGSYVSEHGIAACAPAASPDAVVQLVQLIQDPNRRAALGRAARRHAEHHFELAAFQRELRRRFTALSQGAEQ
jgi:glycosyltransferase involved in cell wall biosynthesis